MRDVTGLEYPQAQITFSKGTAMAAEHWFDTVNKLLAHDAPRRGLLSVGTALIFTQRPGGTQAGGKKGGKNGKNKGHRNKGNSSGKGKGKKPRKPKPNQLLPPTTCSDGACNREFVFQDNREWCEFVCHQCDGDDPRDFCIVWADPSDPDNETKIADCCEYGETCCGASCCPEGRVCCGGDRCCQEGHTCCDGSCCGTNNPYTTCCDGRCMNTEYAQDHCGACGNACGNGEICVAGSCVCEDLDCGSTDPPGWECCVREDGWTVCTYTTGPEASDPLHCGACNVRCPGNQSCTAGTCGCQEGSGTYWCASQEWCIPESYPC